MLVSSLLNPNPCVFLNILISHSVMGAAWGNIRPSTHSRTHFVKYSVLVPDLFVQHTMVIVMPNELARKQKQIWEQARNSPLLTFFDSILSHSGPLTAY